MRAMILGRKLRIQEAQAVATAAATPEAVTQVAATPEGVVATLEAATRVEGTPAVEDPEGDKIMAGGIPRMTKRSKS